MNQETRPFVANFEIKDDFLGPIGLAGGRLEFDRDEREEAEAAWAVISEREERRKTQPHPTRADIDYCLIKAQEHADNALSLLNSRFDREILKAESFATVRPLWQDHQKKSEDAVFFALRSLPKADDDNLTWLELRNSLEDFVLKITEIERTHLKMVEEAFASLCPLPPLKGNDYYSPKDFVGHFMATEKTIRDRYDAWLDDDQYQKVAVKSHAKGQQRRIYQCDLGSFWRYLEDHPPKETPS